MHSNQQRYRCCSTTDSGSTPRGNQGVPSIYVSTKPAYRVTGDDELGAAEVKPVLSESVDLFGREPEALDQRLVVCERGSEGVRGGSERASEDASERAKGREGERRRERVSEGGGREGGRARVGRGSELGG